MDLTPIQDFRQLQAGKPLSANTSKRKPRKRFASGGPIGKGQLSLVGELGPELFVPNASGHIIPNNQLTPGNDIAAASSSMFGGGGGGTTVLTNAPITNSSTSTIVNVQTPRMATDPNTQKQSGYALSGWAKFD
jgi:hypothetical protein